MESGTSKSSLPGKGEHRMESVEVEVFVGRNCGYSTYEAIIVRIYRVEGPQLHSMLC